MYETKYSRLAPTIVYLTRLARNILRGLAIVIVSLGIGMIGYRHFEGISWVESFENAAMILSGMGPVMDLHTVGGKIFAGMYALFSGIVFLVVMAIVIAPVLHRFLHKFHIEEDKTKSK